jgi:hypothetical protein
MTKTILARIEWFLICGKRKKEMRSRVMLLSSFLIPILTMQAVKTGCRRAVGRATSNGRTSGDLYGGEADGRGEAVGREGDLGGE